MKRRVVTLVLGVPIAVAISLGAVAAAAVASEPTAVVGRSVLIAETPTPTVPATGGSTTEPKPEPTATSTVSPPESPVPTTTEPPETTEPNPTPTPEIETPTATAEPIPPLDNQQVRPASPPAVVSSEVPWPTIAIAAAVILVGTVLVIVLSRPRRGRQPAAPRSAELSDFGLTAAADGPEPPAPAVLSDAAVTAIFPAIPLPVPAGSAPEPTSGPGSGAVPEPSGTTAPHSAATARQAEHLALLTAVGEAMVDSGYPVGSVRRSLEEIAASNDMGHIEVLVFPTAMMVSVGEAGTVMTSAVTAGDREFRLYQIDALDNVVRATKDRSLGVATAREAVTAIASAPQPYSTALRLAAYGLLSVGLSILLGASLVGVGVAAVLGLGVGGLLLAGARLPQSYQVLVLMAATFGVSAVVFLLVRGSLDPGVLPSLVAPLVILLPGGLLTTSVIELATGQFMSGAARLAAGGMRLVLLATGIVAAAALVGIPAIRLESAAEPLGQLAPWLAVALFGVGIAVYQCARPAAIGWIVLVLYVAYGAQVIGSVFFGGVLSAFIGALVMTPVAMLVARHRKGPAMIVSFLPAFWLLVPGALGLVGVTSLLDGDASGIGTLVTTTGTMVAIALGALFALGITRKL